MIKILPNTKFSYSLTKGSISSKTVLCEELNDKVFRRMLQLFEKKNSCGIGVIKNSYNGILPEKKYVEIAPLPIRDYDNSGGGVTIQDDKNTLKGYLIELPANKKKKLNILELSSFMHESTHVLDYLINPKYVANLRKMYEKNIFEKDYFEVYEKYFYSADCLQTGTKREILQKAEEETRKALKTIPDDEKIIFLNYMKYNMEMEYHAYNQDIKYARILQKLGKPIDNESLEDINKTMYFPEKIKLINQLLHEEISYQKTKILY